MSESLKIAIIGDYNFTYNSHHATNLAIDHSSHFLDVDISYYWIKLNEVAKFRPQQFDQYDGIFIAPGPIKNWFFFHGIIKAIHGKNIPTLITGEGFRTLIEVLVNKYQLNPNNEKLISDNLVEGDVYEKIDLMLKSEDFIKLYDNYATSELTATRYSLYPQLIALLENDILDIDAYNQFEDPEIVSLKNHFFFVACGFCPQISSTREIPHPVIYTFIKACLAMTKSNGKSA